MNNHCDYLLTTAYFPPIEYFKALARGNSIYIEACENFQKQSYRNRCNILASDGILSLTVPVSKGLGKNIREVEIDYSHPWLLQHKRALISAYMSSPFFEYYKDDIFKILESGETHLFTLNKRLTEKLAELAGIKCDIKYTEDYIGDYGDRLVDLREKIHPKRKPFFQASPSDVYYQVFSDKFGFTGNLSILDLLFNEGPNAISFL